MRKIIVLFGILLFIFLAFFLYIKENSGDISHIISQTGGQNNVTGLLHISGTQIIDSSGKAILLQGAMMESSFAYINRWNKGQDPTQILNSNTFQTMKSWNMNAIRINISQWIYQLDPNRYLQKLDQAVIQANQAGLYVIIDFHNDAQSGAPTGKEGMLHKENVDWWKLMASHFRENQMVLFDPINEPRYPDWQTWLHGDGGDIVGFQDIIDAIRSTGAEQIIVVEPGSSAGKGNNAEDGGWATYSVSLTDPNILYSKHDYHNIINGNPTFWDHQWGPLLNKHPIYYGEWAVLPYADHPVHCQNLNSDNAEQITMQFLEYLKSRNASWTYWDFEPYRLIENYIDFTPTSFKTGAPWTCDSSSAIHAGAGEIIKSYLTGFLNTNNSGVPIISSTVPFSKKRKNKIIQTQ